MELKAAYRACSVLHVNTTGQKTNANYDYAMAA